MISQRECNRQRQTTGHHHQKHEMMRKRPKYLQQVYNFECYPCNDDDTDTDEDNDDEPEGEEG